MLDKHSTSGLQAFVVQCLPFYILKSCHWNSFQNDLHSLFSNLLGLVSAVLVNSVPFCSVAEKSLDCPLTTAIANWVPKAVRLIPIPVATCGELAAIFLFLPKLDSGQICEFLVSAMSIILHVVA